MNNLKSHFAKPSKLKFHDSEEEEEEEVDDHEELESLSSEEEQEEDEIERELAADVTFEELHKARSDGSLGLGFHQKDKKEKITGRANKNRPMEASCKKPVGRFREVIQAPKKVTRDPRFESLCGNLDTEGFRKRYDFLFEETLPAERQELCKKIKKSRDPKDVEEIKSRISWIDKQLKPGSTKHKENAILVEHKRKERAAANQGKQPFYLKKSEIRKLRNIEKFNELKAAGPGKLETFMEKRRRKNAAKDHRHMPYRRPNSDEQS